MSDLPQQQPTSFDLTHQGERAFLHHIMNALAISMGLTETMMDAKDLPSQYKTKVDKIYKNIERAVSSIESRQIKLREVS